jgi:hypothetical protein
MSAGDNSGDGRGEAPYKVGKGNPPIHTRFQKGNAGNRKGRLKKPEIDVGAAMISVGNEKRSVKINGRLKKMSRLEAAIRRQCQAALEGNTRAARAILGRAIKHGFVKKKLFQSNIDIHEPDGEMGNILRVYPRLSALYAAKVESK